MEPLKNLGLKHWWNIILYLGVLLIGATLMFEIDFIENKHLFGLGIGLIFIGLSHVMAFKHVNIIEYTGYWSTRDIIHSWQSRTIFVLGLVITILFTSLIIYHLV